MATVKKSRIIALLSALVMCVMAVCSSVAVVFAESGTGVNVDSDSKLVIESGIDPDGIYAKLGEVDPDEKLVALKRSAIVSLAIKANVIRADYSDEKIASRYEVKSRGAIKAIRDDILNNVIVITNEFLHEGWMDENNRIYDLSNEKLAEITAIENTCISNFDKFQKDAAKAVTDQYSKLKNDAELQAGLYDAEGLSNLDEVYALYVDKDGMFVNPVLYNALRSDECYEAVNTLKGKGIRALNAAPKNVIDVAYNAWMDFEDERNKINPDEDDLVALMSYAEKMGRKAVRYYENLSASLQTHYSGEIKKIKDFLVYLEELENDPLYVPIKVSEVTNPAIKVVAKSLRNGKLINALPKNCTIKINRGLNAAAKRNATVAMKKHNKELSVAYFLYISMQRGKNVYDLPTKTALTDENGKPIRDSRGEIEYEDIMYEVTIDLEKYYTMYLEDGDIEKNKFDNIKGAYDIITGATATEGLSLCYNYAHGSVTDLDARLEGGKLVFTTSNLNNICVAGSGLETITSSPWFWVGVVVLIILLLIVIRILVKHVKYAIRFDSNGGSPVPTVKAAKNEYFVMPQDPVKNGFVFAGWYTDKEHKNRFIETYMRRRKSIRLYAKWAAPVSKDRLLEMYEILRDAMRAYKKESFKAPMGLASKELVANMYLRENYIELNLSLDPDEVKKAGFIFTLNKNKKSAEVPVQLTVSTEPAFEIALTLVKRTFINKGLQHIDEYVPCMPLTAEERKNGFAYYINNERVAETAEDYFELLRVAVKSYVLERENPKFKPGDKITLARIYITNEVACLHLPVVPGERNLSKPSRDAVYKDTPVLFRILTSRDMEEAYNMIDKVMTSNGFTKCPENANNLADVKLPATNGFAYTLKF